MRRSLVAALVLGVALAPAAVQPAQAYTKFVDGIGLISGYYHPGSYDYTGLKQPSHDDPYCVRVERKTSGIWKTEGITNYLDCSASDGSSYWEITGDAYARNTDAIRLKHTGSGQWFYLCSTKTTCQGM